LLVKKRKKGWPVRTSPSLFKATGARTPRS
jgi:hypothetical protein